MARYECEVCGLIYDETNGVAEEQIAPGTSWEELPESWLCPDCGAPKSAFVPAE